jgi:uncharacterized protein
MARQSSEEVGPLDAPCRLEFKYRMQKAETLSAAFGSGGLIGVLGGLIGLGGAEFRLPLLIGAFGFPALEAVILNKATSLIVVTSALPFRMSAIPLAEVLSHWSIILNLLVGSLVGDWVGASFAVRIKQEGLYKIIAILLVVIAAVLLVGHDVSAKAPPLSGVGLVIAGILAGFLIGNVASPMGVAGGELLIPTFVLLYGIDIKLAGSLSLATSLPTMHVGFTRYSRDQSFNVLKKNKSFLFAMAAGSLLGTFIGGRLVGIVPGPVLLPLLSAVLFASAVKIWLHESG